MARTAGWTFCPMTSKKLGRRTGWFESWRRRRKAQGMPLTVTWYQRPCIPAGYRGKLD